MRHPGLASLSFLVVSVSLALSGCGGTQMGSSLAGNNSFQSGTPPTVSAVAVQVNGVAPNRAQEVQFSEAMDPSTLNAQSFQVTDPSGKAATGTVTYDPDFNTASFQPSPALQAGANYTATISTAAASSSGAHLAQPYTFEFTTRATTDTSPIMVDAVSPFPDAPCVSVTSPITITFDEAPDASTVTASNFMVSGPNGAISVKISTNVTTTQVVLTPTSPLPSGSITVTVSNVADLAGVKMTAPFTWTFSTVCNGGGGGSGGGTSTQYMAPLIGNGATVGQVTVDTAGNVTLQLHGAAASQTYTEQFCAAYFGTLTPSQTTLNCFTIGTVSTDSSGNANSTAKFPQPGAWVGDFSLSTGATSSGGYGTHWGTGYMSTLLAGPVNTGASPSTNGTNGTITYSSSPAPNGSLTFTIMGGQANTSYGALQRDLYEDTHSYGLNNSQGEGFFTTNSAGNVTFTVLPESSGGDIFGVLRHSSTGNIEDYNGGFLIPQ